MSVKKIKKVQAPSHEMSLIDSELEARSNLAVSREARGKQKEIVDQSLGSDMTNKILKNAIQQLEEHNQGKDVVVRLPENSEELEEQEDLDLEVVDEESRELFDMFSTDLSSASHKMDKELAKTRHQVDERVRGVYTELGQLLKYYKSEKLPKAVNVLASQKVPGWLDLLLLSEPWNWSPEALAAVTKLFVQTGSDKKCLVYFSEVLMDYVQRKLDDAKKLKAPIWSALKSASRRPKLFIRAILLPLALDPQCSVKEARVISSLITQVKLPADHVSSFIVMLCTHGDVYHKKTIFISRFINKGQALAIQAIDAIVSYFLRYQQEPLQPILWHQALLDFVRKYGTLLTPEQREAIDSLIQIQQHKSISPEVHKLLEELPYSDSIDRDSAPPIPEYL